MNGSFTKRRQISSFCLKYRNLLSAKVAVIIYSLVVGKFTNGSLGNEAFVNRHVRTPREKEGVGIPFPPTPAPTSRPTTDPCTEGQDGIFGTPSQKKINISYKYEIVVKPEVFDSFGKEVVPAVERSISESLTRNFIGVCGGVNVDRRALMSKTSRGSRKLAIIGIESNPADMFDESALCESSTGEAQECGVVNGGLAIYVDDESSFGIEAQILSIIQQNMKGDLYVKAYDGIILVAFIGDTMSDMTRGRSNSDINPPFLLENPPQKTLGFIIIAMVTVFLIMGSVVCCGENEDNKKESDSLLVQSDEDAETIHSVVDTTIEMNGRNSNNDLAARSLISSASSDVYSSSAIPASLSHSGESYNESKSNDYYNPNMASMMGGSHRLGANRNQRSLSQDHLNFFGMTTVMRSAYRSKDSTSFASDRSDDLRSEASSFM